MCQISSLMAATEGHVAEFSSFANFEEKKRKLNLLMSFPKIGNQMGSFGQIRKKKSLFRFFRPILDIFGFTLLNSINMMSFQSCTGLRLISLIEIVKKVIFYKVFEFLCCSLVLNRNKDSVIFRLKIDKRDKPPPPPPLQISASLRISAPFSP